MPQDDENTQIEGSPGLDETEGTPKEPEKKVTIPGLEGEYTQEEVLAWKEDSENKSAWRRELDEKGTRLNERERELAERNDAVQQRLDEIERKVTEQPRIQPSPTEKSWQEYETPEEQTRAFLLQKDREDKAERERIRQKLSEVEGKLSAQEQAQLQEKKNAYWTGVSEDALDKYVGDDPDLRKMIDGFMRNELSPKVKYWNKDMFFDAAKRGVEIFEAKVGMRIKEWAKGKKKSAEQSKTLGGQTPAPKAGERSKRDETRDERIARMMNDPNIRGYGE